MLEALRTGAAQVLDMQTEDLEILVIGQAGTDHIQGLLYDPMPGGSGLLDQICERFDEVVQAARNLVDNCPSDCVRACVDCLLRFRNAFFHSYLNRKTAGERFRSWGERLQVAHDIPPNLPRSEPTRAELPVNQAEQTLRRMILDAALPEPEWHKQIDLGRPLGTTSPDCYYPGDEPDEPGVCVYLDGLSEHIHGNPETHQRDRAIREQLRAQGYEVIEIAANEFYDPNAMASRFFKLARLIDGRDRAQAVKANVDSWYVSPAGKAATPESSDSGQEEAAATSTDSSFTVVEGRPEEQYKTCVPLMSLKAAAGGFGESMEVDPEAWVKPNTRRKLEPGMFVAQVIGKSMEPEIPDGAYCLFRPPAGGSRTGRRLLVQHRDIDDLESGGSFTLKIFDSRSVSGKTGQERTGTIYLRPANPEYEPIELTDVPEEEVRVVAECIEVLTACGDGGERGA